ncbi:PPOX class F420-dependent oxidoreductase [Streptomyces griseosporeus]|uniref:PPOX class F420-dependent oxidoreductase n=1 Tax=Streptomyces griseosporeus TaxID=1910 RepID=UPI0036FFA457
MTTTHSGEATTGRFSEAERAYLRSQRLGRMATVDPRGQPQANPVGFFLQDDGTILVGGYALGTTKKWRNLRQNPKVALVVDDVVSVRPWRVRGVDIRGEAELLVGPHDLGPHLSEELIRIHPRRIHSWGLEPENS